jgi:hypothetical protein
MWQNVAFFMSRLAWAGVGQSSATALGVHRWRSRPWWRSRGTGLGRVQSRSACSGSVGRHRRRWLKERIIPYGRMQRLAQSAVR